MKHILCMHGQWTHCIANLHRCHLHITSICAKFLICHVIYDIPKSRDCTLSKRRDGIIYVLATTSAGSVVSFKSKLVYVSLNSILFFSFVLSVPSFYAIFIFLLLPQLLQYNRFFYVFAYSLWHLVPFALEYCLWTTTISRFSNDDAVEYFTPFPHTHMHCHLLL